MGAQALVEVFRTGERGGTFRSVCTITYFGKRATIQGLSGVFSRADGMELMAHLMLSGITEYEYKRLKRGKMHTFVKPVRAY